ncbi:MAG: hypothetical protein KDK34_23865, partial [Leptospiraceae bacterium]|nr:hypothetical protein [Leptospiraceae bacterium]
MNTISGGTIHIDSNTITGNVLESINSVGGGIALWANSAYNNDIRVVNNQISGNEAAFSGGIQCRWTRAEIINNTIISNTAGNSGGGMRVDTGAEIAVANTIFWNNNALTGPQIYLGGGTLAVAYSDVEGGWSGEGNIDADPLVEGDSLTNASPAIGAGALEYDFGGGVVLHSPEFDINGRMRPYPAGTNPDMGARESKLGAPDAIEP